MSNKMNNRGFIFDIGGGSTELTFFNDEKNIFKTKSLSYGVINLSEKKYMEKILLKTN